MPPRNLRGDIRLRQPVVPLFGRARRPHRLGHQHLAPLRRRRAQDLDVAALDAEAVQQSVHRKLRMVRGGRRGEFALRVPDAADRSARPPRRDRCRAPAAPPRPASGRRRRAGISRSPASNRSNRPRSPAPRDARSGARLPPRSADRAAPPVRSCRFPADAPATPCARCAGIPASAASIGRAGPAPVCRARPSRRRASPCRPSAAPDRRPAPASRPGRRPPAAPRPGFFAQAATRCASVSRRSSSPSLGGMSSGATPPNCSEPSANASSSSSMSPSATMRGRIAASVFSSSRKISRASRPARRVGR